MRVFVTGMGAITAIGENVQNNWDNLVNGNHGIRVLESMDPANFRTKTGGEIPFDLIGIAADLLPGINVKNYISSTQMALISAKMAVDDASLDPESLVSERAGLCLGSGLGGIVFAESAMRQVVETSPYYTSQGIHPLTVPFVDPNFSSSVMSRLWHLHGPQFTVSTACSSSNHALGQALMMIQTGKADLVMTGGMESSIMPLTFSAFDQMRAMSTNNEHPGQACRPFSQSRSGFVMGDAAGMLVLESEKHMEARGGEPLVELVGYGASGGGYHMVKPRPDGTDVVSSMSLAIQDAGIDSAEVDCINTHGTGTKLNDKSELEAINQVFNDRDEKLLLMANKANIGHTLGAAGAVEAIFSIKAMQTGILPPFINFEADDELDYSKVHIPTERYEKHSINCVLSNSFGFGNNNASVVFKGV